MGKYIDFAIKYDPATDTQEDLTKRILYALIIKRIKAKKPTVIFMGGDSGEGKSFTSLRVQEILLELQGLSLKDYVEDINVFTPLEYPTKLDKLLFDKTLKKINIICMHEAREVVKAKLWHSFLNQAISDVNAMSRSIKRLCFIVISQFIRDISSDIRYTLNYYVTIHRPINRKPQLSISVMWKDDRDLEKPKLRKRPIRGYLVYPGNKYRLFQPQYLELSKPNKEIIEIFEKRDYESKAKIIRSKVDKLIQEMKSEIQPEDKKVVAMVEWYISNPENLNKIGKRIKKRWRVNDKFKEMHDLTDSEAKEFQQQLNDKMKELEMV